MVEDWGTGRKDYSAKVETSIIPVISSHEGIMWASGYAVVLNGYISVIGINWPVADQKYVWFDMTIQIDSNELILLGIVHNYGESDQTYRALKMGYGRVDLEFPKGLRVEPPDNLVLYVGNYTESSFYKIIYVTMHGFSEGLAWTV